MTHSRFPAFATVTLFFAAYALALGCSSASSRARVQGEGVVLSSVPLELRDEYALFAQRCSKCHSLARALNNGERDEKYWALYVTRMRRQPSSGIAPADEPPILRFLNFHSAQLRAESAPDAGTSPGTNPGTSPGTNPVADAGAEAGEP